MNNRLAALLVCTLLSGFLLNGVVHALVPHTHENDASAQSMHAALRVSEKLVPLFASIAVAFIVLVAASNTFAVASRPVGSFEHFLHRGRAKYRRFG